MGSPIGTNQGALNVGVIDDYPQMCGSIVKATTQATTFAAPPAIQACPGCQDVAGWKDKDGYTCNDYSSCKNGNWRVKDVKHYQQFAQKGQTAHRWLLRMWWRWQAKTNDPADHRSRWNYRS